MVALGFDVFLMGLNAERQDSVAVAVDGQRRGPVSGHQHFLQGYPGTSSVT